MTSCDSVKIRKIIHNAKGFQHGVLLPEFAGDIDEAFDYYSKLWMEDHCDKDGVLFDYINEKDADYIDEFTVKDCDYFYIGIPNSYAFEGITGEYVGYPGCNLDKYGFEEMIDVNGKPVPYFDKDL